MAGDNLSNPMRLGYDLDKIKFATDGPTFERAVGLYENGKVTEFEEGINDFSAVVLGTKPYRVSVEARRYDYGHCECYLGQNDMLCKHMVAVAIHAVCQGKKLTDQDKQLAEEPSCSNKRGALDQNDLDKTKTLITAALRHIKSYNGPSRIWFAYQNSLAEGCHRLAALVADLPVSAQTAKLLVDILLRLEKKISSGVDDSDGTVGGFMEGLVRVLKEYAKLDSACLKAFHVLRNRQTSFGWEEPLLEMLDRLELIK